MRLVWTVALLAACSGKGGGGDDTDGGMTVTDPREGLSADPDCEAYDDGGTPTPIPGATGYYVGDFAITGEDVVGTEWWILFANQAWQDSDDHGQDCQIAWQVTGQTADPDGCASCDYALAMHATLDESQSDCVEGLVQATEQDAAEEELFYNVAVDADGNATVYFQSGNRLGDGTASETEVVYRTDGACNWF